VDAGSFSLAAEKLGVQTPAVSKAIAKLEDIVGKKLLNRSTRTLESTDVGKMFYAEGLQQLISIEHLLESVGSWNSSVKGKLKITSTPAVGEYLIAKNIAAFRSLFPAVSLNLMFTNDIITLPSQNIDIALRSSDKLEDSCLTSRKLLEVNRIVVASSAYIEEHGKPEKPEHIVQHQCLNFYHRKQYNLWAYSVRDRSYELSINTEINCNSYTALKDMCVQGMGVSRLFEYQVSSELQDGSLIKLLPSVNWGTQSVHAVYHNKMNDSPKVKAFIEHFQSCYR
jgi:DNA-binding transcriptional LysR family regulator